MGLSRVILVLAAIPAISYSQGGLCTALHSAIKSTYDFKPSKLSPAQRETKSIEMDKVWNLVEANPAILVPCLTTEMQDPTADHWFLFDGGGLLTMLDHTTLTDQLVLRGCEAVDLDDVVLEEWMRRLTSLALRGVDISVAADRWMNYPKASFVVAQHAFTAERPEGAFFLYGSMDEGLATAALLKIITNSSHPQRELALSLLAHLATSEADRAFRSVNLDGFPAAVQTAAKSEIARRPVFEPRTPPKLTRAEILAAFQSASDERDFSAFAELAEKVPDGEREVVTLLKQADLPLIRSVRRALAASLNPHLMEEYPWFTGIISTIQSSVNGN